MNHEPASGIDDRGDARLVGEDLLRAQRDLRGLLRGQREHLVHRVGVQRVGAAEHRGKRLERGPRNVVLDLLGGERAPGGLGVEAQLERALVLGAVPLAHVPRPDAAGSAVLGDLLEEVDVGVEEERQPRRELVDVEPALDPGLHVGETVGEGERQLLRGGASGLADVVPADRDRIPVRDVAGAELDDVGHEAHRGPDRKDELLLGDVFLEDVVLQRSAELRVRNALLIRCREVHREEDRRRGVDGHRRRDRSDVDAVEEGEHVLHGVDRHAAASHLTERLRRVRSRGP